MVTQISPIKKKANGMRIAVIGESGAGKGTYIKVLLDKFKSKPQWILSTVNDYGASVKMYFSFKILIDALMGPISPNGEYRKQVTDTVIIVDEAQVWLPKELNPDTNEFHQKILMFLANCRKNNNLIIFIMHGFRQLPLWLPLYLNGIERFYTSDNLTTQRVRFSQFPQIGKSFIDRPDMKLHEHTYIHIR